MTLPTTSSSHPKNSHNHYISKLEAGQVHAAVQELPVDFREIILFREYKDLSYREIVDILHCLLGTVMSHLGRASVKLGAARSCSPSKITSH